MPFGVAIVFDRDWQSHPIVDQQMHGSPSCGADNQIGVKQPGDLMRVGERST
ncbi:MAG: hypothetical protein AAGB04_29000 [Pseudomonadota bacterium]